MLYLCRLNVRQMMKIIIDDKIPYIRGEFEKWTEVEYMDYHDMAASSVKDAEVLVVRTRTRCDATLLQGSKVRLIATATIGMDHIDIAWCESHGIKVVSAPGCNAPAVGQWVGDALRYWAESCSVRLADEQIAIVGYGHVGHEVVSEARRLGMGVELVDPYVDGCHAKVEEVIERCRVVTYHVPLNDETHHLCNENVLKLMNRKGLVINAARGGIIDEAALLSWLEGNSGAHAAIDCWENEPAINMALAKRVMIATPHIAGYSAEGKWRGTRMVVEAIKKQYGWGWNIGEASEELKSKIEDFEKLRRIR